MEEEKEKITKRIILAKTAGIYEEPEYSGTCKNNIAAFMASKKKME